MHGRHRGAQNQTTATTSSVLARGTGSDPGKGNRRLRHLQYGTMAFTTQITPGTIITSVGPTLPIVRPGLQKCGRPREQHGPHREPCATPLLQEGNRVQEVRQTTHAGRITRSQAELHFHIRPGHRQEPNTEGNRAEPVLPSRTDLQKPAASHQGPPGTSQTPP